ncbi:M3 family metallopeptidase [Labilibaculum euxinus]|uniref:Peptidase M3 n=1 Tax=Labilibaculum euxinus TaxID=2686357 RepID=A0A7M4D6K5_9BACT|nr:M3 family metallopeptidase [Labilibaculum euxinus]MUP38284.1 peptidase M3 [Labilibaculum euxinus]MVB07489.1 peptidase M3 [Labilibaculum euxinus]
MKKTFLYVLVAGIGLTACNSNKSEQKTENPFFADYNTPHQTAPFDLIKFEHFEPAFMEGMKQGRAEIDAIANNTEAPTFENTIEAMDKAGQLLTKVSNVFFNLSGSDTNDSIQALSKRLAPELTKYGADIDLNENLFKRVKAVYEQKDALNLDVEANTLLEKTYKGFVRGGADLDAGKKAKLRAIDEKLSLLTLQFGENQLAENNAFVLLIDNEDDLAGLPESVKAAAAETATAKGEEGKWAFTLDKPSMLPFLQYADNRELRKKIYMGYVNRCNNDNEFDNKKVLSEIANLRVERAQLFGFKSHADYILAENMAKTPEKVFELLNKLWDAALPNAKLEAAEMQKVIDKEGGKFKLASYDWWYYAEKVKKAKYNLDESELRPYFEINNVRDGAFELAHRLYGINFIERNDISKYNKDVQTWELQEADGTHIGIFYLDYFPRASKRGGAWMNSFRKQSGWQTENAITPIICNVCNFTKPVGDQPALLSVDEVETLFHEFGHALHGFLSRCKYNTLSGTAVSRDFVELPSQVMENWCLEPEMLALYAKHYQTGEVIPVELVKKVQDAGKFNQGFATVEYLAASLLDMKYHTLSEVQDIDVTKFEDDYLKSIGLIPEIYSRYRSTYFAHIFSGGYSSGYYAYIWAGVLDSDAFQAFKETGLFNKETAAAFRNNVLAKGGTEDPMKLYKRFRGAEPNIDALLIKRGLK